MRIDTADESRELRRLRAELLRDLPPRPWIYWLDFGGSTVLGWTALTFASSRAALDPLGLVCSLVAAVALTRSVYFVHEIAHQRKALPGFEVAWNLLCGIWFQTPSIMVDPHADHHRISTFGTKLDPEYEPVARWGVARIVFSVLVVGVVPPLLWLRWGVLGPVSHVVPPLRRLLVARGSTLATNDGYLRRVEDGSSARFLAYEALAGVAAWTAVLLVAVGVLPVRFVEQYFAVVGVAFMLNQLRTNVAHAYENAGGTMTLDQQVADSTTVEGGAVSAMFHPVGTRWHAMHHLAPQLPYHALPEAHRRLLASGAPRAYTHTRFPHFAGAVGHLVERAMSASRRRARAGHGRTV